MTSLEGVLSASNAEPAGHPAVAGQVVLVVQGGGAQAAYQGGAFRPQLLESWLRATGMLDKNLSTIVSHPRYDDFWKRLNSEPQAGKVRALAIDSIGGFPGLPNVPTVEKAADLPGFDGGNWYGLMAPAGTPKDIINKLQQDIAQVLKTPSVEKAMLTRGITPVGSTPEEFGKFFESEIVKWAPLLLEDQKTKAAANK